MTSEDLLIAVVAAGIVSFIVTRLTCNCPSDYKLTCDIRDRVRSELDERVAIWRQPYSSDYLHNICIFLAQKIKRLTKQLRKNDVIPEPECLHCEDRINGTTFVVGNVPDECCELRGKRK